MKFSLPLISGVADKLILIFYNIKHNRKSPLSVPIQFQRRTHMYLLLLLCGDVSLNPGPVKNPCGICSRPIAKNHRAILCEACYCWHHIKCAGISQAEYVTLGGTNKPWCCQQWSNFHFSDSFFSESEFDTSSSTSLDISDHEGDATQSISSALKN